jgi:hypothetical protein
MKGTVGPLRLLIGYGDLETPSNCGKVIDLRHHPICTVYSLFRVVLLILRTRPGLGRLCINTNAAARGVSLR